MQTNHTQQIIHPLKQIDVLTQKQLITYVTKATDLPSLDVEEEVKRLMRFGELASDEYNVSLCSIGDIDRKDIIAFWTLIAFADKLNMRFSKANWPSQLIFRDERIDKVLRITVCDNPKYDSDMIAMIDTQDDYHMEIIVGNGFDYTEINPDMLPKKEYIYANLLGSPLLEAPEIKFRKVDAAEDEKKEG